MDARARAFHLWVERGDPAGEPGACDEFCGAGVECEAVHDGGGGGDGGQVGRGPGAECAFLHREEGGAGEFGGEFFGEFGGFFAVAFVGGFGAGEEVSLELEEEEGFWGVWR